MSSKQLKIVYVDYDPTNVVEGEVFAFQKDTKRWITREDAEGRLAAAFEVVLNSLHAGDQLSIVIEVQCRESR